MSKTRVEIQFNTLSILVGGIVGDAPSAEDAAEIDKHIDAVATELNKKGVVYISDVDALDDELFDNFCELVANSAANKYGGKPDPAMKRYYENEIRVIVRQTPGYGPQQVEFF